MSLETSPHMYGGDNYLSFAYIVAKVEFDSLVITI
jgi:hypothetical protein